MGFRGLCLPIPAVPCGRGALSVCVCVLSDLGFGCIEQLAQVVDPASVAGALFRARSPGPCASLQVPLENGVLWNRQNMLLGFLVHSLVPLSFSDPCTLIGLELRQRRMIGSLEMYPPAPPKAAPRVYTCTQSPVGARQIGTYPSKHLVGPLSIVTSGSW